MIDAPLQRIKSTLLWELRNWFHNNGYHEVITPVRVLSPALEENLMGIEASGAWLRTSPEFALKKVISSGVHRLYEIGPCFRADECGDHHSSEFLMLEWYRVGAGMWSFMDDVVALLNHCARWANQTSPDWQKLSASELLDPDLEPETWFYRWVDEIEPQLPKACIVYGYPKWQAALARTNQNTAERFEVYWNNIELGNAFHEELSGSILKQRWIDSNLNRRAKDHPPHPIDEQFLSAVSQLPRCSGIAIGIDRLLLCLSRHTKIQQFQVPSGLKDDHATQR